MAKYTTYKNHKPTTITGLEKIPQHWEIKQVRYLLLDGQEGIKIGPFGSALKLEDMVEVGYKVYGQENVIKKNFSLGKRWISENKFKAMQVYRVHAGDILITMMGTSGKCEIVPDDCQTGIIDSHLIRLGLKKEKMLPRFFKLLIDGTLEIEYQVKVQGKGSIMHGLNSSIIKNLELPLPPLLEQNDILSFLDYETAQIDTLIEKQQTLIQLLKEKRQAVISHAVTKGLNLDAPMKVSGVEWLGDVPEHWEVKKLKYVCDLISQKTEIDHKNVIALENIESWTGNFVPSDSSYSGQDVGFDTGDILFSKLRPYLAKVYLAKAEGVAFGDLLVYRPKKELLNKYGFYLMTNEGFINTINSSAYGSKMPRASTEFISEMPVVIPLIQEQKLIVDYVDKILARFDGLVLKAEQAIQLMQERRTALISAAVTGKIDVRGWVAPESKTALESL